MENIEKDRRHPFPDRRLMQERLKAFAGIDDVSGIEITSSIAILANLYDAFASQADEHSDLSGARWGLLMRLLEEESLGNCDGITPTFLSRARNVSKNTTSSLLRGLEDQGLIERNLDPNDRRIFRIRLTEKGRALTQKISPKRIALLSSLSNGLKKNEREQLITLLGKLIHSLIKEGHIHSFPF